MLFHTRHETKNEIAHDGNTVLVKHNLSHPRSNQTVLPDWSEKTITCWVTGVRWYKHTPIGSFYDIFASMDVSENNGTPQIIRFNKVFHYKPSILGYHYFWKHLHVVDCFMVDVCQYIPYMDTMATNLVCVCLWCFLYAP